MVLCVFAMKSEALYMVEKPTRSTLLLTGIGKVNAAIKLSDFLARNSVDCIINFGFAGGSSSYQIGDLVLIKNATYHDFDLTAFGYQKGQVPGCPTQFDSDFSLMKSLQTKLPHIKTGSLYSGDYFMTESKSEDYVVDMEGASLYQTAYFFKVPIISVKVISDVLGMEHHLESFESFAEEKGATILNNIYETIMDILT
jgi:adenosylhomocysteine nucleosidase